MLYRERSRPVQKAAHGCGVCEWGLAGPGFNYDMLDLPVIKGLSGVSAPPPPPMRAQKRAQAPTQAVPAPRMKKSEEPPPKALERTASRILR